MRRNYRLRYALGIILTTIILTGVLRKIIFKPEVPVKPYEHTKKYMAFYQYNYDGDTAVFYVEDLGKQIVRFLGVDSPEKDEEGFEEAKSYTDRTLSDSFSIILELEPYSEEYDNYERLLAWVWVDDELLQAKLLQSGNAKIRYLEDNYLYTDYLYSINVTK
ncbi:MAG: thermonuclease family protein [Erysipelotrichaceae bacterium]|nr:thermonuclease family protein [Erysipelotrichaceae bacterium]MBP5279753.1 thermonuclease family protein [Erysipelotrichaceae bacterium]